ncbi:MAG: hypothetical protein IPJ90_14245 [Anaerolineaceae bacterium]|nr:hypothetical protein [Anaerolineaceae bacterium]
MGEYDLATARLMESIDVYPEGDHASELAHLGLIAQETLDLPTARRYLQQAYDQAKRAEMVGQRLLWATIWPMCCVN